MSIHVLLYPAVWVRNKIRAVKQWCHSNQDGSFRHPWFPRSK